MPEGLRKLINESESNRKISGELVYAGDLMMLMAEALDNICFASDETIFDQIPAALRTLDKFKEWK